MSRSKRCCALYLLIRLSWSRCSPLHLNLCLTFSIQASENETDRLETLAARSEVASALRAVADVNSKACTFFQSASCLESLVIDGETYLKVNLTNMEAHSDKPSSVLDGLIPCKMFGAHLALGLSSFFHSEIGSWFGSELDLLVVSHRATSPYLSDTELYPSFSRTSYSYKHSLDLLVILLSHWRLRKVLFLYDGIAFRTGEYQYFKFLAPARNLVSEDIFVYPDQRPGHENTAYPEPKYFNRILQETIWVAVLQLSARGVASFLSRAHEVGVNIASYAWFVLGTPLSDVVYEAHAMGIDPSLLRGLVSVEAPIPRRGADLLQEVLQTANLGADGIADELHGPKGASGLGAGGDEPSYGISAMGALNIYDAVWAAAFAYAKAIRESPNETVTAARLKGALVSLEPFTGASGEVAFEGNGNRRLPERFSASVLNVQEQGGRSSVVEVGSVHLSPERDLVDLNRGGAGRVIIWPDGSAYPKVPWDDGELNLRLLLAVPLSVVLGLAVLLAAFIFKAVKGRKRVAPVPDKAGGGRLDLETPFHRILAFLERYHGWYRRPSAREAAELRDYLLKNSGRLQLPDFEAQLRDRGMYSKGVSSYLLDYVMAEHEDGTASSSGGDGGGSELDDRASSRFLEAEDTWVQRRLDPEDIVVPEQIRDRIGRDFFLDTVSDESALACCPSPLGAVFVQCLDALGLSQGMPPEAAQPLLKYMLTIEAGYPDTFYHCKLHAADVTHRLAAVLLRSGIAEAVADEDPRENLAMLNAAAVHDFKHPQLTNAFLVHNEMPMALQFNDQAVAENYALRESRMLVYDPELNFTNFHHPDDPHRDAWKKLTDIVMSMVLATDMGRHFSILSQFKMHVVDNKALRGKTTKQMWRAMGKEQRSLTLQMAIKVADLGHNSLPIELSKQWVKRLEEEFFRQWGDLERRMGMKVSPLMDRRKPGVSCGKAQVGFIDVIVLPLLENWVSVFPQCEPLLEQARANRNYWAAQSN